MFSSDFLSIFISSILKSSIYLEFTFQVVSGELKGASVLIQGEVPSSKSSIVLIFKSVYKFLSEYLKLDIGLEAGLALHF